MKHLRSIAVCTALTAIAAFAAAPMANAAAININFDSLAAGTLANNDPAAAAAGISFSNAVLSPELDGFGDPIPGSDRWRVDTDPATPAVLVESPAFFGYGPAPSAPNALEALFQPVLLMFRGSLRLTEFSVILDNSNFGDLFAVPMLFLDGAGNVLGSVPVDETIPGFVASLGAPLDGVAAVLLPSGALFDDLRITAVPEPGTFSLLLGGLTMFELRRRTKS